MRADADHSPPRGEPLGAGLLIVTGASHTGKTSVIQALLPKLSPPVAVLAVDEVLRSTLVRPAGDPWREIPLAYELIQRQVEALLERDWFVIVESTFTYVPNDGGGDFHGDVLARMVQAAKSNGAAALVYRLQAPLELTMQRAQSTGRLGLGVVATIARLHEAAAMPDATLELAAADKHPEEIAEDLRRQLVLKLTPR